MSEVQSSWRAIRELYLTDATATLFFEKFAPPLPKGPTELVDEISALHDKQRELVGDVRRQAEIEDQADTSSLMDIYRVLGIEDGEFFATEDLVDLVLQLSERVGHFYKELFNRPRPNELDPTLRPFIAVPPHASYPSNHSFQMFCVAEVMSRVVPEQPATAELFYVAERVAENREYAGLHYESDTLAGRELARRFAVTLLNVCREEVRAAISEWN